MCQRDRKILPGPGDKSGLEVFIQSLKQMVLSVDKGVFGKVIAGRDGCTNATEQSNKDRVL